MVSYKDIFAPSFFRAYNDIEAGNGREFWFKGGRGSCKSSFVSSYIVGALVRDACEYKQGKRERKELSHAVVYRKVGSDLRDSVFTQILWSIEKLGLLPWFEVNRSSMRIKFLPTSQQILFRGLDDAIKSKSIKAPFGYFRYLWFEELTQFNGMEEIRSVGQSVRRGGHDFKTFMTYNPPITMSDWVNIECNVPHDGRRVYHSDYRSVPRDWLGEDFIAEAEDLRKHNPRAYAHEYLGAITGTGGSVFPNVVCREIPDAEIARFDNLHYGQDWGFTNAFVWIACHLDKKRKRLYLFDEIYGHHLTPSRAAELVKTKDMHGEYIIADCEDPAAIAQFNNEFGISVEPAQKGADSRRFGFRWLQSLHEIVIDPNRCPNAAREFQMYEFKKGKDGNFIEDYPKDNDHAIDAVRYAMESESLQRGLF